METDFPDDVFAQIKVALFAGRKIEAIKVYRQATGKGLAESKAAVEAIEAELQVSAPEQFRSPPAKGCAGVLVTLCGLFGAAMFAWAIW